MATRTCTTAKEKAAGTLDQATVRASSDTNQRHDRRRPPSVLSPDGKWIAFFLDGKLMKVPVTGGTAQQLPTLRRRVAVHGWRTAISIHGPTYTLVEVPARVEQVGRCNRGTTRCVGAIAPSRFPGTGAVLFTACNVNCASTQVWVLDRQSGKARKLIDNGFAIGVAAGHLLYALSRGSIRRPIQIATAGGSWLRPPVLENVLSAVLSSSGTAAVHRWCPQHPSHVVWVTRDGSLRRSIPRVGQLYAVAVSPEGIASRLRAKRHGAERLGKQLDQRSLSRISFKGTATCACVES